MVKMGDFMESEGKDIDILMNEVALAKQLIQERAEPLDLLRELIANAGAREVAATEGPSKLTLCLQVQSYTRGKAISASAGIVRDNKISMIHIGFIFSQDN